MYCFNAYIILLCILGTREVFQQIRVLFSLGSVVISFTEPKYLRIVCCRPHTSRPVTKQIPIVHLSTPNNVCI
jgi:hypothetical protein